MGGRRALIEHAEFESESVAICLWNHRQKHNDCIGCATRGFCNLLMKQLQKWGYQGLETTVKKDVN